MTISYHGKELLLHVRLCMFKLGTLKTLTSQNPTNTNVRIIQLMVKKKNNIQSQESSNILISSKLI